MQYRKGLYQQYRHTVETHPISKIGPLSAQFLCLGLLAASMTTQAPSPTRWLRNHVWRIPLRIPKLCGFGRMSTRGFVHVDWQPIDFSCCFCTWPRISTWQNACHIGKGRLDSPFSQRNQRAYCVSICEVQILMQRRFRFFICSTRI